MAQTELTPEQEEELNGFRERYETVMVRRGTGREWDGHGWTGPFCFTGGSGDAERMLEERAVLVWPGGRVVEAPLSPDECLLCPGLPAEYGAFCEACYEKADG